MSDARWRRSEAGFTLVEVILVVVIIAILTAILSVSVGPIRATFALRKAATIAAAEVRRAQALAIAEGADYTVEFVLTPNPGAVKVWKSGGSAPVRAVSGENWPSSVQIRAGSGLESCAVGNPDNRCVTFRFLGAPEQAGEVVLCDVSSQGCTQSTRTVRLVVEPATGRVSVQ